MNHELLPFQHLLLNDLEHFELALPGGKGAGKTVFASLWHFDRCCKNPRSQSWIIAPTNDLTRNACFPIFVDTIGKLGMVENKDYTLQKSPDMKLTFSFGHTVFFKTALTQSLQAIEISHLLVDETGECDADAVRDAVDRVRCKKASVLQCLFTGIPWGLNHYYKRFEGLDRVEGQPIAENKKKRVLNFHTYWNKYLQSGYLSRLLDNYGFDTQLVKAWVLGLFVPLFEAACYKFQLWHQADKAPMPDRAMILGWDFNVGQVSWVALQDDAGATYGVEEAPLRCHDTDEACDAIIKAFPPDLWKAQEIVIDGDASGWHRDTRSGWCDYDIILHKLRPHYPRLKMVAPRANESVQARIVLTNRCLARKQFFLSPRCKHTIESFHSTTYDNKGGISKPSGKDTWTHRSDAATYPLVHLYPLLDLKPMGAAY